MNRSEDWDVIWRWQWFRRSAWQPYFRDPSHPEGRAARTAPIWEWLLQKYGANRVLDCFCGLGTRAILLQEAGYSVVGTDTSAIAVHGATEMAAAGEVPVTFDVCPWVSLAERFTSEFDAVICDALASTITRSELRFALHNFINILKPGGVLFFTGCDQWTTPEDRPAMVDHAWNSAPRFQVRSDYEHDGTHVTLVVARDRQEFGVIDNYLFVVCDDDGARLETAAVGNLVQWTWEDFLAVCREAGFSSLESVKVPVGRREHIINVAQK